MTVNKMWARLSVYENEGAAESDFEAGLDYFREHLLPLARRAPGWVATLNLATADRSRSVTISLWASRDDMQASEQAAKAAGGLANAPVPAAAAIQRYEVTLAEWSQLPAVGGERLERQP